MSSNDRTRTRAVKQVPKFIPPPIDATPAEAAVARGRPRPLPDDFLREASARLGIMSLVGAGLWVVETVLGRLAMRPPEALDETVERWGGAVAHELHGLRTL